MLYLLFMLFVYNNSADFRLCLLLVFLIVLVFACILRLLVACDGFVLRYLLVYCLYLDCWRLVFA